MNHALSVGIPDIADVLENTGDPGDHPGERERL